MVADNVFFTHTWLARALNSRCSSLSSWFTQLPELCLPDLHDLGALEVSVLLALQIKAPEVPEPLLAVPVLNSPTGSYRT